ncbi:MAG TPA: hypothetical protein VM534_10180 [Thermoanaerobaculia bacterium]|nr:hypothetical protein [Thermoanaerobaculia bacterium]
MDGREASQTTTPDWTRILGESLKKTGTWPTYQKLAEYAKREPDDLVIRGHQEILRNQIVRELLATSRGLATVPRHSPEFLSDFDRFDLDAQEGYLISLIDGRLSIESLLKLSPLDHFSTLFNLARLRLQGAITLP